VNELRRQIADEGLDDCVRLEGYQPDAVLAAHLSRADVVVNLRNPHLGESSWSLVEALGSGAATVVWGHGFYDEFPDDVLCKVRGEAELLPVLERLVSQPQDRAELGLRAREHVRGRFHPHRYRERFQAFVDTVRSHRPVLALIDRVSDVLLELGSGAQDDLRANLEARIASFLPADAPATGAARSSRRAA
jgi:glycosyltransferase involved in cell wall biosynthesis